MISTIPHVFLTGHPGCGKTTMIKTILSSINNNEISELVTKGFYTEECRSHSGERIGFDILHWHWNHGQEPRRDVLARLSDSLKKGDHIVGKYLVNTDNINKHVITSISETKDTNAFKELVIVDEVGKMEMLSPDFIPAVKSLLNETLAPNQKRMIIGTLPTPRYGKIIQAVEDIRERNDVVVLHVTKSDRDQLALILQELVKDVFMGDAQEKSLRDKLEPYLYKRAIGSSSIVSSLESKPSAIKSNINSYSSSPACGPLILKTVQPKVLILGETASPMPINDNYSYCDRSMWIVLGKIFNIDYNPIKDLQTASENELKTYQNLKELVLSKGICIWDVLANIHEKGKKKKRRRNNSEDAPNDINALLVKYPSIEMIGFIGQKAQTKFNANCKTSNHKMVTLPSSSQSNSRMTVKEKVDAWKSAIMDFIPDLQK